MDGGNQSLLYKFAKSHFPLAQSGGFSCGFDSFFFACTGVEVLLLVLLSNLLHIFLKRIGQPSTVSQMLAGFILGPTVFGHFNILNKDKSQLESIASSVRVFFMFLVSLEIDIPYLRRTIRSAAVIVAGSAIACLPISIVSGPLLSLMIARNGHMFIFTVTMFLALFNTASPILIRVVHELKLAMTDIGRLAISSALVTDVLCLIMLGLVGSFGGGRRHFRNDLFMLVSVVLVTGGTTIGLRMGVNWVNKHNSHRSAVGDDVVVFLLMLVFTSSVILTFSGCDPMVPAFLFGLFIPRDGPTARTIIQQLTYAVNNLLLPVYFGVAAVQVDLGMLRHPDVVLITLVVIVLGIVGKTGGTMAAAKYLGMQMRDSLILSLLLNIRGHVNLMAISLGTKFGIWNDRTYMALIISLFVNSIGACPIVTYIVRQDRQANQYMYNGLEWLDVESELRILACIHSPNEIPTILNLVEISTGVNKLSLSAHILHLMKLVGHATTNMLYHQLGDVDHDDKMGGHQAQQVNVAVDSFIKETSIHLHQLTVISRITSMHEDVQNAVQDTRPSLVVVPFHRKLKLDGKMGAGKEDVRQFNTNVIAHTPCSVGILVDRGMKREQRGSISSEESMQIPVVVLFLGGPDDREAAAYGGRLALHSNVNVTLVRFKPKPAKASGDYVHGASLSSESSVLMDVKGEDADEDFMANFYNRFVVTGMLTYEERAVQNPAELITELQAMMRAYSLYIVGRKVQGPSEKLTEGMSDWEESPELGSIGDLLASTDFILDGSILVIRQYNESLGNVLADSP